MEFTHQAWLDDVTKILLENLHESVVVLDGDLRVQWANASFYQTFQFLPEEVESRLIYESGEARWNIPSFRTVLEEIRGNKSPVKDFKIERNFSSVGPSALLLNATPIVDADGTVVIIILSFEDISGHERMQQECRQLLGWIKNYRRKLQQDHEQNDFSSKKETLRDELLRVQDYMEQADQEQAIDLSKISEAWQAVVDEHERTEHELRHYAEKLEWTNRELEDFASVASHDLQEPLRKIRVFGGRLLDKYGEVLDASGRDYLERLNSAAERMQTLLDALLAYSRVAVKTQPYEKVDLTEVLEEVVSNLEASIEQTGAKIFWDELPTIQADRSQMVHLLQNLLINAIKFHRPEEPPLVKVSGHILKPGEGQVMAYFVGDRMCQIYIEDNGIGFDEKYLERVFAPFQRLHSRSEYGGTGIGLAICQKIVQRHRGTITARSKAGAGSTFTVTLPVEQS
jgi:light-regulated signal transduction histidine kinase (bacteriophytochrome)